METSTSNFSDYLEYEASDPTSTEWIPFQQTNSTSLAPNITQAIAFSISTFLITVLNTLTLVILHKTPSCFEEIPRLIFQALAITDLLTGLFCCFFSFLFSCAPHLQNAVTCTIRTMACTGCLNQSALTMAFASVDRYIAIKKPLRYPLIMTKRRARTILLVLACVSVGNAIFTNVGADLKSNKRSCVSDFTAVGLAISFRPSLVVILFIFYSSLIISTFANYNVVRIALRHSRIAEKQSIRQHLQNHNSTPSLEDGNSHRASSGAVLPRRVNRIKMRSLWTVVMATVSFYILVMPWNIMASLHFAHHVKIPYGLRIAAAFLLINNSWWNAVIYSLMSTTFRRAVGRTLLSTFGRQVSDLESTIAADASLNSCNNSP